MFGEDYQDLQKFGTNIKDRSNSTPKKKVKIKLFNSGKLNQITKGFFKEKKICKNILKNKTKNISKIINISRQWANKKLNAIDEKDNRREKQKDSIFSKTKSKYTKQCLQYRLIETRKQRGNKTIVIRKRIPIKPNNGEVQIQGIGQKTLFEFGCDNSELIVGTSYKPKISSIWDVPIENEEKKGKFKIFFDFWNGR